MSDKNFPPGSPDSSKEVLAATTMKGDTGDTSMITIPQPWQLALPCDADGSNVDYSSKEISIYIIKGNSVLASGSTANGWVLTVESSTNLTVTATNLIASVDVISADHGNAKLKLAKTGETSLYVTIFASKIKKGAQGDQGIQGVKGDTGAQGDTGATGAAATGFVVNKYTVTVVAPDNPIISNNSGKVRLTYSSAHGLESGERLHVFNATSYDSICSVTTVVSTVIVDTDLTYSAVETVDVRKMRLLCKDDNYSKYNNAIYQNIEFPKVIPLGGKPYEIHFQMVSGTYAAAFIDIGDQAYPNSGYNSYNAGSMIPLNNTAISVDLFDTTRSGYKKSYIFETDDLMRNAYVRIQKYNLSHTWDNEFSDNVFNLFVSYKYYNSDYTP